MKAVALALAALLLQAPQEAQEPQAPPQDEEPSFGVELSSVYVDVFVSRNGRPVTDLDVSNFVLTDEGVEQEIRLVGLDDVPVSAVLAFDTSSSVQGEVLEDLRKAGHAIVEGLREAEGITLLTFNHEVRMLVTASPERDPVHEALDRLRSGGGTSLYDATFAALSLPSVTRRPLVVLFTDGADSTSWLEPRDLHIAAAHADALLHVVSLGPEIEEVRTSLMGAMRLVEQEAPRARLMRELAETTGGRYWRADVSGQLEETFLGVLAEIRQRYVLAYEPTGVPPGQNEHRIDVQLRGVRADIRARRSYVAPR